MGDFRIQCEEDLVRLRKEFDNSFFNIIPMLSVESSKNLFSLFDPARGWIEYIEYNASTDKEHIVYTKDKQKALKIHGYELRGRIITLGTIVNNS